MAPETRAKSNATNPLQERVTSLDRSTAPIAEQIDEAFQILRIEPNHVPILYSPGDAAEQARHGFSPKEEWVLRWLLKRFDTDNARGAGLEVALSPSLEPEAWILLRVVIARLPATITARLLKNYKLTATLERTLRWICNHLGHEKNDTAFEFVLSNQDELSGESSSSATIENTARIGVKKSKKRKRDETEDGSSKTNTQIDVERLFICMCSALQQAEEKAEDVDDSEAIFAAEHMKAALKTSPENAARILGSSFGILEFLVRKSNPKDFVKMSEIMRESLLSPLVTLWDFRASTSDDDFGNTSSRTFSAECLLPALQLSQALRATSNGADGLKRTLQEVEKLIGSCIVYPGRIAFMREAKPHGKVDRDAQSFIGELLTPVTRSTTEESPTALPFLFEVVIGCSTRETPKQRTTEGPWLQHFLGILVSDSSRFISSCENSSLSSVGTDVLKQLLRLAISNKVSLSSSAVEDLVVRFSGLFSEDSDHSVDWGLLQLCMEMNSALFMTSSPRKRTKAEQAEQSNTVLSKALTDIQNTDVRFSSDQLVHDNPNFLESSLEERAIDAGAYDLILHNFVLPLLEAYTRARNFVGFIHLWQEQLIVSHDYKRSSVSGGIFSVNTVSVWEDELLVHVSAEELESSLTVSHISTLLQDAVATIREGVNSSRYDSPRLLASVVVLDCLTYGIKSDNVASKLDEPIRNLYTNISHSVLKPGTFEHYEWRLWRILETITSRWPDIANLECLEERETNVCAELREAASRLISQALNTRMIGPEDVNVYRTAFFAFRFMVVVASTRHHRRECYDIEKALLPRLEFLCHLMEIMPEYLNEIPDPASQMPFVAWKLSWDLEQGPVNHIHSFMLSCALQLVQDLGCLSALPLAIQERFIKALYSCAVFQDHSINAENAVVKKVTPDRLVRWPDLWGRFLQSTASQESSAIAETVRQLQISNVLTACAPQGGKELEPYPCQPDEATLYKSAVDNIQHVNFSELERDVRSRLANSISLRLLGGNVHSHELLSSLNVLIRLMKYPRRSMTMVTDPSFPWRIAELYDKSESRDTTDAFAALGLLTKLVLKYAIKTIERSQEPPYMYRLYDLLAEKIKLSFEHHEGYDARSMLIDLTTNFLFKHAGILLSVLPKLETFLIKTRLITFLRLLSDLTALEKTGIDSLDAQLTVPLSSLSGYRDALAAFPTELGESDRPLTLSHDIKAAPAWGLLSRIEQAVKRMCISLRSGEGSDYCGYHLAQNTLVNVKKLIALNPEPWEEDQFQFLMDQTASLQDFTSKRARHLWLQHLDSFACKLTPLTNAKFMLKMVEESQVSANDYEYLCLLRKLFQDPLDTRTPEFTSVSGRTVMTLIEQLSQDSIVKTCVLRMHCLNLIVRESSNFISQWHIDSLLAVIAKVTSKSGPRLQGSKREDIFICLCRLFASILAVHRPKLGGRYHLVGLALRGLLRCLFHPYQQTLDRGSNILPRPPWLKDPEIILGTEHATAYARILTTICDPSVSAVTRSKNRLRQELNDETKKAKNIAGQHLQYLVMEFCHCQLHGRLAPEVRTALNTGLYAIFDAMSQEIMRTVNAALDSSGRSIFKAVYDDYRKFGRWEGS